MKCVRVILITGMTIVSSLLLGQSKDDMPFTSSSPEAKKLLRDAWVRLGDVKFDEAENLITKALEKDPEFGMAYAFSDILDDNQHEQNLSKASSCKLSADEKLFVDGLLAAQSNKSVADHFEPLLKKYPKDSYLNLWIMFYYQDAKRKMEIGEMIVKRNPKFAAAYNMLGYNYMAQNDLKKAEANFNKYVALRPDIGNVYDSKADYLMRVGKIEEAITLFEKAATMGVVSSKGRADLARAKQMYSSPTEKDKQEIRDVINACSAGYLKGDLDEVLNSYSDQAMEFFPNQMINSGIGNIRSRLSDPFKHGSFPKMKRTLEFIDGAGPIAVAWGKTEIAFKANSDGKIYEDQGKDVFLFRKQASGQWKILVHHWLGAGEVNTKASNDSTSIRQLIDKWSFFIKPGEELTQTHVDNYMAIQSAQAVEIYPNQRSNIGIANIRLRTTGFIGIKWAQFTEYSFPVNFFTAAGDGGSKAIAWGIGDHSNFQKGSDERSQFLFPWAMILTKEKDGQWKILAYHFYLE